MLHRTIQLGAAFLQFRL